MSEFYSQKEVYSRHTCKQCMRDEDAIRRYLKFTLVKESDEKTCPYCKSIFWGKRSDAIYCSEKCAQRVRTKEWAKNNPEKIKSSRKKTNSNIPQRILSRIKSKAKKLGIPFNITIDDIIIPDVCPILGIPLDLNPQGYKGFKSDRASVDKIDPSLGYVKGNVEILSTRANLLKNDATIEELQKVIDYLKKTRGW